MYRYPHFKDEETRAGVRQSAQDHMASLLFGFTIFILWVGSNMISSWEVASPLLLDQAVPVA